MKTHVRSDYRYCRYCYEKMENTKTKLRNDQLTEKMMDDFAY